MDFFLDTVIFSAFLVEVLVLLYLELKTWDTLYTPLTFLMLPYTVVLFITICIAGNFAFVDFYYPSILIWLVGLPCFAVPSYILGGILTKYSRRKKSNITTTAFPKAIVLIATIVCLLMIYRFRQVLASSTAFVGSDDFAEDFSGHGVWAHIRQLSIPILMLCIYFVNRRRWWLWLFILILLGVNFINQVKGTIVIAVVASLSLRLYSGKTKLSLKLILITLLGGVALFFISYMALPLLGKGEGEVTDQLVEFVFEIFGHYFTSGILGLSEDMKHGFPDENGFEYIVSPLVNIYNQLSGDDEILSPVNPVFFYTCHRQTNVRTFFGTLYIYSNCIQFIVYTLFLSTLMYMIKIFTIKYSNIFIYIIYFYECALLAMGWFEFYFFHLAALEIPILSLLLLCFVSLKLKKEESLWVK
ncbi:MAG: DUF6337 family protein [Bacteroides sp.]|nr:DUF6337 family protein [Roseburia sp.]MCM1345475.1 DUF6337 family protein [Bacteroides sp.]MCM1419985.1 DUF6337 family protein [Bacteroides sp.]